MDTSLILILVALVAAFLALKFIKGVIKFGVAAVPVIAAYVIFVQGQY